MNTDNVSLSLRKHLLENCNLYAVLDLPDSTFTGAGVNQCSSKYGISDSAQKACSESCSRQCREK